MLKGDEIKVLRTKMGKTQAEFGALFKKGGGAVGAWENETTTPPASTMADLDNLYAEHFDKGVIKEGSSGYSKGCGVGQSTPFTGDTLGKTAREIADEIYHSLSPEARARVDGEYAAMVMKEKAKSDYLQKGRGYDD